MLWTEISTTSVTADRFILCCEQRRIRRNDRINSMLKSLGIIFIIKPIFYIAPFPSLLSNHDVYIYMSCRLLRRKPDRNAYTFCRNLLYAFCPEWNTSPGQNQRINTRENRFILYTPRNMVKFNKCSLEAKEVTRCKMQESEEHSIQIKVTLTIKFCPTN
jgi:hypothetical protein